MVTTVLIFYFIIFMNTLNIYLTVNIINNIFLVTGISVILFGISFAQSTDPTTRNAGLKFDQIGLEQGLSQSTVNAIVQDAQGFIWFGTQNGLNRYDGYTIKVFKHNPKDSNSISDSRINCLLNDSKGDLWIGTAGGGVDRYVLAENKFYHYKNNKNDSLSLSNNSITTVFEDSDENIWIGTNYGLNRYNRKRNTFIHFFFDLENNSVRNGNSITALCEDKEDNIWVGTYKGLLKSNLKNRSGFYKNH